MILMTILTVLRDAISFRGAAKNVHRWFQFFQDDTSTEQMNSPSHSTIGRWTRRVGLFQLTRPLEKVDDMIALVDTSISVGKGKCVVTLGIPRHKYLAVLEEKRALTFKDMQLLDLVVVESVTGEVVMNALERSESRGGTIVQTCTDGGGENVRGVKLFRESIKGSLAIKSINSSANQELEEVYALGEFEEQQKELCLQPISIAHEESETAVVPSVAKNVPDPEGSKIVLLNAYQFEPIRVIFHAYDAPHKLACILKALMCDNKQWKAFITAAAASKVKVQLGDAAHLAPPNQRSKSRYMNMEELVTWGIRALNLVKNHAKILQDKLKNLNFVCQEDQNNLFQASLAQNSEKINNKSTQVPPLDMKNVAQFAWLLDHEEILVEADRYLAVTQHVRNKLRTEGIHTNTYREVYMECEALGILQDDNTKKMILSILEYIKKQACGLRDNQILLASTEIIESLFGKMKHLMNENLKHGLTGQVLAVASVVGVLDEETVKQALEAVSDQAIEDWAQANIGQTYTQKRRQYLGNNAKQSERKAKQSEEKAGQSEGKSWTESVRNYPCNF